MTTATKLSLQEIQKMIEKFIEVSEFQSKDEKINTLYSLIESFVDDYQDQIEDISTVINGTKYFQDLVSFGESISYFNSDKMKDVFTSRSSVAIPEIVEEPSKKESSKSDKKSNKVSEEDGSKYSSTLIGKETLKMMDDEDGNKTLEIIAKLEYGFDILDGSDAPVFKFVMVRNDMDVISLIFETKDKITKSMSMLNDLKDQYPTIKVLIDKDNLNIIGDLDSLEKIANNFANLEEASTAQIIEVEPQGVNKDTPAFEVMLDQFKKDKPQADLLAAKYGMSVKSLMKYLSTPEGEAKLIEAYNNFGKLQSEDKVQSDKTDESSKAEEVQTENKSQVEKPVESNVVQEEQQSSDDGEPDVDNQDPIIAAGNVSDAIRSESAFLAKISSKMRDVGVVTLFSRMKYGLIRMRFAPFETAPTEIFKDDCISVILDVKGKVLSKDFKWGIYQGPITEPIQAINTVWTMLTNSTITELIEVAYGRKILPQLVDNMFNPKYLAMNAFINMNQAMSSKQAKTKAAKEDVFKTILALFDSHKFEEVRAVDPASYFRLKKYTDRNNMEFVSDGTTKCFFHGDVAVPSEFISTISIVNGKLDINTQPKKVTVTA